MDYCADCNDTGYTADGTQCGACLNWFRSEVTDKVVKDFLGRRPMKNFPMVGEWVIRSERSLRGGSDYMNNPRYVTEITETHMCAWDPRMDSVSTIPFAEYSRSGWVVPPDSSIVIALEEGPERDRKSVV